MAMQPGMNERPEAERVVRSTPFALVMTSLLVLFAAAWGGIVPFVGPLFGFGAYSSSAWTWDYPNVLLGALPGLVGVLAALLMLGRMPAASVGRGRGSMLLGGLLAVAAGAWFVFGPTSWLVMQGTEYFRATSHLRLLAYEAGYSIGTGLIVATGGACAIGWAMCAHGGARVLTFMQRPSSARHLRHSAPEVGQVAS